MKLVGDRTDNGVTISDSSKTTKSDLNSNIIYISSGPDKMTLLISGVAPNRVFSTNLNANLF